jgi:glutamate-1-semialdehyde 2,1-aminomutase
VIDASKALFEKAAKVMPGGVNSPVRAFKAVGGTPLFIDRAEGSRIYDVDGNEYIDYVSSWGPLILGHNCPAIREAVAAAAQKGMSFGAPTELEVKLAEKIIAFAPNVAMARMVNSGTEAVMSVLRLARAYTGRRKVIKFEGCYHGHADSMLVKAGSGALTAGEPDSPGVSSAVASDTLIAAYNDLDSVAELLQKNDVACVIVEPVAANMGVVLPGEGFLSGLRQLCDAYGALLVFDEVITGFRLCKGGAQEYYGVRADLAAYGKIIGGGLPVGAYGGRKEIMELVSPSGPVYQAGTLSGNPVAMAAGLAQLEALEKQDVYARIDAMGEKLAQGLSAIIRNSGIKACVNHIGSLVCLFFGIETANDYRSVKKADAALYARYFHGMLNAGIYLAPSQFESMFISYAHTESDINETLDKADRVIRVNSCNSLINSCTPSRTPRNQQGCT